MPVFYSPARLPDISLANLDKIRVIVGRAFVIRFPSSAACNDFKRELGRTTLFKQGFRSQSNKFTVRHAARGLKRWLFDGTLSFKRDAARERHAYRGVLNLELNPSRFINHFCYENGAGNVETLEAQIAELTNEEALLRSFYLPDSEMGIDGKNGSDNLIPSQVYRNMRPALDIFDIYLERTLALIREQIEATLTRTQARGSFSFDAPLDEWSVPHAEIYQEYSVSNAIAFINGLRSFIMPLFNDVEAVEYVLNRDADYEGPDLAWQIDRNAPCLKLDLGADGVKLVIYAKTFDRVRFEVRYNGNVRQLVGRIAATDLPREVSGMRRLLQSAIEDAHRRMRRVFQRLPDLDYEERCSFQVFVDFLADVAAACDERGLKNKVPRLLSLLASNGGIDVAVNSPDERACEALRNSGVLTLPRAIRNARGRRRYGLNMRYANILRATLLAMPPRPRRRQRQGR